MSTSATLNGVRFEYFEYADTIKYTNLTGWYWLDETRGVWNGPFESQFKADKDYEKAELLTRKT